MPPMAAACLGMFCAENHAAVIPRTPEEENKDDFSSLHRTTIALLVFCFGDNTHLALPLDCC